MHDQVFFFVFIWRQGAPRILVLLRSAWEVYLTWVSNRYRKAVDMLGVGCSTDHIFLSRFLLIDLATRQSKRHQMPADRFKSRDIQLPIPRLEYQRRRLHRQHGVSLRRRCPPPHNAWRGNCSDITACLWKAVARVFRLKQSVAKIVPSAFLHFDDAGLYVGAVKIEVPAGR
jgi:hypothetical protein